MVDRVDGLPATIWENAPATRTRPGAGQPVLEVDMSKRTCSIDGCDGPVRSRGWCNKHYQRWRAHGDPHIVKPLYVPEVHGHSPRGTRSPTYQSWRSMIQRCTNPNNVSYQYYGGRGIKVDPRWEDFENFLADMGERPPDPPGWKSRRRYWSLDRVDPDGDYTPENCRWATIKQQGNNRRNSS